METSQIIGFIAATLTTSAFIPQVVRTWKTRSTQDLSLGMFLMICTGTACWLAYGLLIMEWPVIIANVITLLLSFIILFFKIKHK